MINVNIFSRPGFLAGFRDAARVQQSLLASVEKRGLIWLARRMPARLTGRLPPGTG